MPRTADPPALALLAEQAKQMHQDLMTLLCNGVANSPTGWVSDSYRSLLDRSKAAIGSDDAIAHLERPLSGVGLPDLCMALGQLEAALRIFLDEAIAGTVRPMGFAPSNKND